MRHVDDGSGGVYNTERYNGIDYLEIPIRSPLSAQQERERQSVNITDVCEGVTSHQGNSKNIAESIDSDIEVG